MTSFSSALRHWKPWLAGLAQVLRHWPWFDTLRTLRQRFREDHLALTASSLTFTTLISLVPLVTVMLAVFTAFPMFSRFQVALQQYFVQALVPDNIAKPVLLALTQFAGKASKMGSAGLLLLVITALALMLTIDRTLNSIWRVPRPRPLAQRLLVYWAGLTLGPLLLGASLSLTSYALSSSRGLVGALPGVWALLINLLEFGLLAGGVAALFRYMPSTHVRWRHAWAGAVFVALGFEVAKRALAWYVQSVPGYSMVYGAFATLPIFLLWIYLSWLIVLLGAVIAAYAPSLAMRVVRRPDRPGERFALAVALLQALTAARGADHRGLSAETLAGQLRTDPLQVEPVLDDLLALGWCGRLDEPGAQRHVLLIDPANTAAQPLLDRLLLQDTDNTAQFRQRSGWAGLSVADLLR
jgi:membrane protein